MHRDRGWLNNEEKQDTNKICQYTHVLGSHPLKLLCRILRPNT